MRYGVKVGLALLALGVGVLVSDPARADEPIVYSRCPRNGKAFTLTGPVVKNGVMTMGSTTVRGADLEEVLPDTANRFENFVGPCDLVYRSATGEERILYECISSSTLDNACAALDAAVSFDAKTIAFSVFRGKLAHIRPLASGLTFDPKAENTQPFRVDLPSMVFSEGTTDAQLFLVDVASGELTPLPHRAGDYDFGPAFLSNGRLAFTSTRAQVYRALTAGMLDSKLAPQLYSMDLDGRNVEQGSPHALAAELHPIQLLDGRVAVASWQTFGMQAYRSSTPVNDFHIYAQNPDGARALAVYGQHITDRGPGEQMQAFETHVAAHFFGQTSDGRLWTTEYYRHNNFALGVIVGFPLPPDGQEGPSPEEATTAGTTPYRPWDEVNLAPWATMTDNNARKMPSPSMTVPNYADPLVYAGKLGNPSGLPDNRMLLTWGLGPCYIGQIDIAAIKALQASIGDNPACDPGIYRTKPIPPTTHNWLKHPSELEVVVNSPDFHEFMARPVVPYKDIYGVDKPQDIPRAEVAAAGDPALEGGTPFGVLGASSILHRETHPAGGIMFDGADQWGVQGTDTVDYSDDELCGVRILATHPTRKGEYYLPSDAASGERVAIVGEFPVRRFDAGGAPVLDGLGTQDTSFRVRFPAGTPYLMQAIDCQGRTLNTDQTWQSLRPGEKKTCNGCHVHSHAATKLPFETTAAGKAGAETVYLGMGKVPLLAGGSGQSVQTKEIDGYGYTIEFERDIMPILSNRCVSCHGPSVAEAGLRLDLPRTLEMKKKIVEDTSTWFRLAADRTQTWVPSAFRVHVGVYSPEVMGKPNMSKYVRMLNARGSLLYWKAANQRTDGRTDAQFPSGTPSAGVPNKGQYDIDFGSAHPTSITADELGVLSRWIDTGAAWGTDGVKDTIRPSLHVVADAADGAIVQLRVGTADVGDGIDPSTLSVCIVPKDGGECGPNLAGPASLGGVVAVPLATPLQDMDAEVWARVKDKAGNETEARHTVRFLLDLPAPPPEGNGGADAGADAGSGDGGGAAEAESNGDGCSCGVASTTGAPIGAAVAAALGLALRARRRTAAAARARSAL